MPSRSPTRARDPRDSPDSARSSKTIATARSRSSAGCRFLDAMSPNFPRSRSLQETRGSSPDVASCGAVEGDQAVAGRLVVQGQPGARTDFLADRAAEQLPVEPGLCGPVEVHA